MKTINSKITIILILTSILVACSDEFLDYKPIAKDTTESFYTSFESLDFTATAAYGILATRDIYDIFYTIGFQSISDDTEMGGENVNDWPEFQRIDRLTHSANEGKLEGMWGYPYKGIRFANTYFQYAEQVREIELGKSKTPEEFAATSAMIDLRAAEMRFIRAYFHFTLLQIYGGVPIADKVVSPSMISNPRNSIAEVLHFVQADLEAAIPLLKTKSELGADNVGRASKGAAQALLAKAYLYESSYAENYSNDIRFEGCQNRYTDALIQAEAVIGSTEYNLVGINGERFPSWRVLPSQTIGGFRWIFTVDGDNSDESVWEIENVKDGKGWTYSRGNYLTVYSTVRFTNKPDGTQQGGFGWSFNLPSKYMLNAFGNNDARETGLNSVPTDSTLDPRYLTTVGMEGDTVLYPTGSNGTWVDMNFSNLPTGTIGRKFECSPSEYWGSMANFHDGPFNIRLIRYADVVLMAAEAAIKSGDNPKALDYVNQVRKRARMSGETGYPLDLTAVSFEDIVHERRLEFACETNRFFDLVRWNLAYDYINNITLASMGDEFILSFVKGKHEFFPIPTTEIQISKGALKQYEGWQ
ncbi:MAG: RagB/SusD family nutrient uptake outer membrane protein [Salinivirgaceae bacterium]